MLECAAGLSARDLDAIAELEREVVESDGGRLKLEWGRLRSRSGDRVEDVLWWEHGGLVGFLGIYGFGSSLELAGMVAPKNRGRGIGSALLDAAMPLCRSMGCSDALLIVPRRSAAGKRLAVRRGAVLHHSEHALVLAEPPAGDPQESTLRLRPAAETDGAEISRLLEAGFGQPPPDGFAGRPASPHQRTMVVEVSGAAVGTLSLKRERADGAIYGFVIDPPLQSRGFGRDALRRACQQLHAEGARHIRLEVAVDNDRALGLYTSVGFRSLATEDYFALPLS